MINSTIIKSEQLNLFDERMNVWHQPPHLTLGMFLEQMPVHFLIGRGLLAYLPCCCGSYDKVDLKDKITMNYGCDCGFDVRDKERLSRCLPLREPVLFRWVAIYPESETVIRFSFQTCKQVISEDSFKNNSYDFKEEAFQEVAFIRYHLDGTIEQSNADLLQAEWFIDDAFNMDPKITRGECYYVETGLSHRYPYCNTSSHSANWYKHVIFHLWIDPSIQKLNHPVAQRHAYFQLLHRQNPNNIGSFAQNFMAFHRMIEKFPQMEQVIKAGYYTIGWEWLMEFSKSPSKKFQLNRYLKDGTKLTEIMPLPKPFLKELRKQNSTYKQYQYVLKVHETSPLNEPSFQLLLGLHDTFDASRFWRIIREKQAESIELLMYLRSCQSQQGIPMEEALILWDDYYQMAQEQTLPYKKFPQTLKLAHDLLARDIEKIRDEKLNQQFEERANALADLNFEDEETGYGFFVPQKAEDLIREGRILRHCVGGYQRRFAEGKTTILFVRSLSNPNQPLYTLEWDLKKKETIQFRGYCNANVTDRTVLKCLRKWKERQFIAAS